MIDYNSTPLCLSGAAQGADSEWGRVAGLHGHNVAHFTFKGHKCHAPHELCYVLDENQLALANDHLLVANQTLKRRWPVSSRFVGNLLRRNYWQVSNAEQVYAVSGFECGLVKGGTSWAVQMFLDAREGPQPCYVFDQENTKLWFEWDGNDFVECEDVPVPSGVYAAIGSRALNQYGLAAISNVFGNVK